MKLIYTILEYNTILALCFNTIFTAFIFSQLLMGQTNIFLLIMCLINEASLLILERAMEINIEIEEMIISE